MAGQKKIFLEPNDGVDLAVDKILGVKDKEVVLNIPRNSLLGSSINHFQLVRQKAVSSGKRVFVESVDDHILELAELAGLQAVNPVFKVRGRPVADILPVRNVSRIKAAGSVSSRRTRNDHDNDDDSHDHNDNDRKPSFREVPNRKLKQKKSSKKDPLKSAIGFGFLACLLGIAFWLGVFVLPKATIALELQKYPAEVNEQALISINTPEVRTGNVIVVPGEILKAAKNVEMSFPTTGKADSKRYAEGKLTIYNAYGKDSQTLVATTRFETPDGKIFRLKDNVKISGAAIIDGKIKPSQIDVWVKADKPGPEYNIGPISKWTIPGFKSDPKRFEGFYGFSSGFMRGGVVGEQAAPTEVEITEAKKKIRESLLNALKGETAVLLTDNFEVLSGTTAFEIKREDVYPSENNPKDFSVFMEAELRQFVFDKEMMRNALIERSRKSLSEEFDLRVKSFVFQYENPLVDLSKGEISLSVKGNAIFESDINTDVLKSELLGKSEEQVKEAVFKLPGLDKARVSLWPFWVKKVPQDIKKVEVKVN